MDGVGWQLVFDEQDNVVVSGEQVLICNTKDETLKYITMQEAQNAFPNTFQRSSTDMHTVAENVSAASSTGEERNPWTRNDIQQLIALYDEHQHLFKSTTTRNDKVWYEIATKIKTHSAEQCKNKFFYLKGKYTKQKDNMSSRATGTSKITFTYFDEMDKLFGKEPNVTPVAIASSTSQTIVPADNNGKQEEAENAKTQSTRKPEVKMDFIKNLLLQQQNDAERRHQDNLAKKDEAIAAIRELIDTVKGQQTGQK